MNQRRSPEHKSFLEWLRTTIQEESVNALIIAGDIFDNRSPTLESQELYYQFLNALYQDALTGQSVCRHVVIIGGNHDSATLLEIPKPILKYLNIQVVAKCPQQWSDALLELKSADGQTVEALVAAFPYLSDVDLRKAAPGETAEEKTRNLMAGIRNAYRELANLGVAKRNEFYERSRKNQNGTQKDPPATIPLIATGHLFTQGGKTLDGDGVRNLYVGSLEEFSGGDFPSEFDYVALGHLHVPQRINQQDGIRYSGSPIPIGFNEASQEKIVVLVNWSAVGDRTIETRTIPRFQPMVQVKGSWEKIELELKKLVKSETVKAGTVVWLEVVYTDVELRTKLNEDVNKIIKGTSIFSMGVKCPNHRSASLVRQFQGETLATLDPRSVFERILNQKQVLPEDQAELMKTYQEALELCDC